MNNVKSIIPSLDSCLVFSSWYWRQAWLLTARDSRHNPLKSTRTCSPKLCRATHPVSCYRRVKWLSRGLRWLAVVRLDKIGGSNLPFGTAGRRQAHGRGFPGAPPRHASGTSAQRTTNVKRMVQRINETKSIQTLCESFTYNIHRYRTKHLVATIDPQRPVSSLRRTENKEISQRLHPPS